MSAIETFLWSESAGPAPATDVAPRGNAWWGQYSRGIRISSAAKAELDRSSRQVLGLIPDPLAWGDAPRPAKGLVVGAVQSGKTAHMMALSARALDHGYKIIIVLAGAKDDLRTQTARRFNSQLLQRSEPVVGEPGIVTIAPGVAAAALPALGMPYWLDCHQYALLRVKLTQSLSRNEPAVLVIKKNAASLADLSSRLQAIYRHFGAPALPTLVLDDECDEASVDEGDRTIPEAIANLWLLSDDLPPVAYIGYTATAAANLLQSAGNPLYPDRFACLMRYPGKEETDLTFLEPDSDGWYTGSQAYYSDFGQAWGEKDNFLVRPDVVDADLLAPVSTNPSLLSAVRGYLVAGAYRLAVSEGWSFAEPAYAPGPHTMLVQTSPELSEHERWAEGIREAFEGARVAPGCYELSVSVVERSLQQNPEAWQSWYRWLDASRERLYEMRPHASRHRLVGWHDVRALIPLVVSKVKLKVLNSDARNAQSLDFERRSDASGNVQWPQDIFTIVVGGAKLSRGLTIDGLCVSYFCRWNPSPTDDTVLQISRWFGYRGRHLEFSRLFTTRRIADGLAEIGRNDLDLRYQLAELMTERRSPRDAAIVLACNPRGLPTGKLGEGKVVDLAFSPYSSVFRHLEVAEQADANVESAQHIVDAVRTRRFELVRNDAGELRGELSRGWTADEVAGLLNGLRFTFHNPPHETSAVPRHHRGADLSRAVVRGLAPSADPYLIAAYLKLWKEEAQVGRATPPPQFNVGFAHGELSEGNAPFDFPLMNRAISPNGQLESSWTGRSANWRGDAFFDRPPLADIQAGSAYRKNGADGLLLLYILHKNALGRAGDGLKRATHSVTFGLVVPAGGPVFRRVTVTHSTPPAA